MSLFLPYNQEREECYLGIEATRPVDAIKLVFPKIIPGFQVHRVLDIGTGPGDFVRSALEHGFDAYGVDIRNLFVGDRTRFRQADATKGIPFPNGFFDLVFDHLFLDDLLGLQKLPIDEVRKVIDEIHRVLRNDGYFFMNPPLYKRDDAILNPGFRRLQGDGIEALYQRNS